MLLRVVKSFPSGREILRDFQDGLMGRNFSMAVCRPRGFRATGFSIKAFGGDCSLIVCVKGIRGTSGGIAGHLS